MVGVVVDTGAASSGAARRGAGVVVVGVTGAAGGACVDDCGSSPGGMNSGRVGVGRVPGGHGNDGSGYGSSVRVGVDVAGPDSAVGGSSVVAHPGDSSHRGCGCCVVGTIGSGWSCGVRGAGAAAVVVLDVWAVVVDVSDSMDVATGGIGDGAGAL